MKSVSLKNSGADIKAWIERPVSNILKLFLKLCLSNEEDGTQEDIPWDDSEQSGEVKSSEYRSATGKSLG
jgi:hypothetical protein